jgi:choline dehydrogenase
MDPILRGGEALEQGLEEYYATGQGRLAANGVSNHMAFYRLPDDSPIIAANGGDPGSGGTAPHYEHAFGVSDISLSIKFSSKNLHLDLN